LAAQELHVDYGAGNVVRFISRTQVDEFEGVTDGIDGFVHLDGPGLPAGADGDDTDLYFEVDLASLDTGIGLRNRHMRDNYLEVDRYPYATFEGEVARLEPREGEAARITATGALTIHGISRKREISCDVLPTAQGYRARCAFPVLLSDHAIEIPSVMFLKLANEIDVRVELTVSPAGGHPDGKP
jgi:polyisoprenoid-binding protein YceI